MYGRNAAMQLRGGTKYSCGDPGEQGVNDDTRGHNNGSYTHEKHNLIRDVYNPVKPGCGGRHLGRHLGGPRGVYAHPGAVRTGDRLTLDAGITHGTYCQSAGLKRYLNPDLCLRRSDYDKKCRADCDSDSIAADYTGSKEALVDSAPILYDFLRRPGKRCHA